MGTSKITALGLEVLNPFGFRKLKKLSKSFRRLTKYNFTRSRFLGLRRWGRYFPPSGVEKFNQKRSVKKEKKDSGNQYVGNIQPKRSLECDERRSQKKTHHLNEHVRGK
jgi:hypothetical protein